MVWAFLSLLCNTSARFAQEFDIVFGKSRVCFRIVVIDQVCVQIFSLDERGVSSRLHYIGFGGRAAPKRNSDQEEQAID